MTPQDTDPGPWLVAHRGAMAEAPENTEIAFEAALRQPVDGIEFDVQLTQDAVPVIFHDDRLGRVTGQAGEVGDYPCEVLKAFDYGRWYSERFAGTPIPTLEDVLRRYAGKTALLIELKTGSGRGRNRKRRELVQRTLEVIAKTVSGVDRNGLFILSFDADALISTHELAPDLKCILNLNRPVDLSPDGANQDLFFCRGFGLPLRKLTRTFSDAAHRAGKQVMTYSCDTPDQVDAALRAGADFVLTDDPARVASHFNETIRVKPD